MSYKYKNYTKECDCMKSLFERYKKLNINGSLICLEQVEDLIDAKSNGILAHRFQ